LFYVKAHPVAVIKALEPGHVDGGMVNEYVATLFLLNKTESLFIAKPFYDSVCHSDILLSKNFHGSKLQVATFDKWNFPLERNKPAHKGEPS
jgi:hypothetical protein